MTAQDTLTELSVTLYEYLEAASSDKDAVETLHSQLMYRINSAANDLAMMEGDDV